MNPLKILTWHIHGNYLYYLSQARVEFLLPVASGNRPGFGGRGTSFPFAERVREVPVESIRDLELDAVLFQTRANYEVDRLEILSDEQQRLPMLYLEHDPPQGHPTDTRHWFDEPDGLLVHVTPFNALMWDNGRTPTTVIDHGVMVPERLRYTGELERGVVVVNNLRRRGRRLGADIFERARAQVPLDLVGMDAASMGGLGEVRPMELAEFERHYRFFFHPIRYTSLGLAVLEAMMLGMPVVGLATTELAAVIENGVSGHVDTDVDRLIGRMRDLLRDPEEARRLGDGARMVALERFSIDRFARRWEETFSLLAGRAPHLRTTVAPGLAGDSR